MPPTEHEYLIWSFEHKAWWKPCAAGYTEDMAQAGRYSLGDALVICFNANRFGINEGIIPIEH